jgi:hypothetical protein
MIGTDNSQNTECPVSTIRYRTLEIKTKSTTEVILHPPQKQSKSEHGGTSL